MEFQIPTFKFRLHTFKIFRQFQTHNLIYHRQGDFHNLFTLLKFVFSAFQTNPNYYLIQNKLLIFMKVSKLPCDWWNSVRIYSPSQNFNSKDFDPTNSFEGRITYHLSGIFHFHLSFPKNLKKYDKIDNFRLKSRLYQKLYREENLRWYGTIHRICSQKNIKNLICDRINKIKV